MAIICIRVWVHGMVQGVGFRYSTQREAKELGVKGYAKNLDDGSVEVQACGEAEQVEALLAWLKAGGRAALVSIKCWRSHIIPHNFRTDLARFSAYRHLAGFGSPAIFVACFAGPFGNSRNR